MKPLEEATIGWAGQKPLPKHVVVRGGTLAEVCKFGYDLLQAHAEEAEPGMASKLAPDWPRYQELQEGGNLIILLAWHDHTLLGYAVAVVFPSAHYARTVICQHDLLYVRPEWRSRGIGLRLIQRLRGEAKARGATDLLMHAKPGSTLEALLPRLGFKAEETVWKEGL